MNLFGVIGEIGLPDHLNAVGDLSGTGGKGGLIGFVSNLVKLIMIVGGIWSFFNLILAGFAYIASGDNPEEVKKANTKITMSLIGLVLLVGSIILAGIIGFILYGDASAILNPKIYGPGQSFIGNFENV